MNNWALIGNGIDYSLSPLIHNFLCQKYRLQANYQIHNTESLSTQTLELFECGNITIPFKLDAYKIAKTSNFPDSSINCFKRTAEGYQFLSTDQFGIIDTIDKLKINYINTRLHVIFGDGATSDMIANTLQTHYQVPASKIYIISRKNFDLDANPHIIDYQFFENKLKSNYVLYNTTPLGNGKQSHISPYTSDKVKNALAIYDATYNPLFNQLGKIAYQNRVKYVNGLNMLIVQGLHGFEFWTGINAFNQYHSIRQNILWHSTSKLIICAMPFAGKTTLYKRNRKFACDLDSEIEKYTGIKNAKYIEQNGIEAFREVEAKVFKLQLDRDDIKIIFLGGGTLTSNQAISHLDNHLVVYMKVSLNTLKMRFDKSRANIQSVQALEQLYKERDRHYRNISQLQVTSRGIERMINEYLDN